MVAEVRQAVPPMIPARRRRGTAMAIGRDDTAATRNHRNREVIRIEAEEGREVPNGGKI